MSACRNQKAEAGGESLVQQGVAIKADPQSKPTYDNAKGLTEGTGLVVPSHQRIIDAKSKANMEAIFNSPARWVLTTFSSEIKQPCQVGLIAEFSVIKPGPSVPLTEGSVSVCCPSCGVLFIVKKSNKEIKLFTPFTHGFSVPNKLTIAKCELHAMPSGPFSALEKPLLDCLAAFMLLTHHVFCSNIQHLCACCVGIGEQTLPGST